MSLSSKNVRSQGVRRGLAAAAGVLLVLCGSFAGSAARAHALTHKLDIPAQALDAALQQLAIASHHKLFYKSELVAGKTSPALKGDYTTAQAVQMLLSGTNLTFEITPSAVVLIRSKEPPQSLLPSAGAGRESLRLVRNETVSSAAAPEADQRRANSPIAAPTIEEIVVTAQKRTENLRDVPASISVVGQPQLESFGASKLSDYASYVPGLNLDTRGTPGQTTLTLRGIAQIGPGRTVGTAIDEAPLGSSANFAAAGEFALDLLPDDIQRIEVLRGPQGTLYGASTMGGLLKYVTVPPDLRELQARVSGDFFGIRGADERGWGARAGINIPLVDDTLGLRASYFFQETPGYIDNGRTGRRDENELEQDGGRLLLRWQATQDVTVDLGALLQTIDAGDNAMMSLDPQTLVPLHGDLTSSHAVPQTFVQKLQLYTANVRWNTRWGELTSASSYAKTKTDRVQDGSAAFGVLIPLLDPSQPAPGLTPFTFRLDFEKLTQEVRLASVASPEERIEWLMGAFYTDERVTNFQQLNAFDAGGGAIAGLDPLVVSPAPTTYREYAAFGNLTFKLTERFDVTGGLRWAHNQQHFQSTDAGPLILLLTNFETDTLRTANDSSESVLTYSVSPRWRLNDTTMLYGRWASGYRPGGPNFALPTIPPSVDADKLVSYELGVKSELFDHRVFLDAAVFYVDWDDIQITAGDSVTFVTNGGNARSQGAELALGYAVLRGLRLGMTAAYTDATLTQDAPSVEGRAGSRLPGVPVWSGAFTADYERMLSNGWRAMLNGGYRYVGNRYSLVASSSNSVRADDYRIVDFGAGLANDRWTARLYVRNVTDERAYLTPVLLSDLFGTPVQVDTSVYQPRTVGLTVDVRF